MYVRVKPAFFNNQEVFIMQTIELFATVFVLDDIEPVYIDISNCINPAEAYQRVLDWFGQSADNIASIQLPSMQNSIVK